MRLRGRIPRWPILVIILVAGSVSSSIIVIGLLSAKPDFSINAIPDPLLVKVGQYPSEVNGGTQFTTVTARSLRSFSGIVTLQAVSPAGISAHLYGPNFSAEDKILLGLSGNLSLGIGAASPGNYTVKIVASSGALSHSIELPVIVQNLTMTLNPTSITIAHGMSGTVQVALSSINALSGNLTMASQTYYYDSYGNQRCCVYDTIGSFAPSTLMIPPDGIVTTILTITVASTAMSGTLLVAVSAMRGPAGWQFSASLPVTVT